MKNKTFNFNNESEILDIVEHEDGRITIDVENETIEFTHINEFAEFFAEARGVQPNYFKNWHLTSNGDQYIYALKAGTAGLEYDYDYDYDDYEDYEYDEIKDDYMSLSKLDRLLFEYHYNTTDNDQIIKFIKDDIQDDITLCEFTKVESYLNKLKAQYEISNEIEQYALLADIDGEDITNDMKRRYLTAKLANRTKLLYIVKDGTNVEEKSLPIEDINNHSVYCLLGKLVLIK